jgi:hypothetical protein
VSGSPDAIFDAWAERLAALGHAVRAEIIRRRGEAGLHAPVAHEGGDTIYAIDRKVEPIIVAHAARWAAEAGPVRLTCEGLNETGEMVFPGPHPGSDPASAWRVLIDPIDGTRNIMYDKRSAWFLGAVAPGRVGGGDATLGDCVASVMMELPTSKADRADDFVATASAQAPSCVRSTLDARGVAVSSAPLPVAPSAAPDLRHGWGQVTNFFPGTKVLAADLMERIAHGTLGAVRAGEALVFDDQYLTTGGQLTELVCGRDRFCCDLRPLLFRIVRARGGEAADGLCCHPYDMAGLLIARRAGVIITDGFGRDLDAPFAVDHDLHWCGYANESLRDEIEPIIQAWLREHGAEPG